MPSRYEPCGLTQMYAMRYGTVPVVHRTGGLADTVRDAAKAQGNGFVFEIFTPGAFRVAMARALDAFRDGEAWGRLVRRGMNADFSWDRSAAAYEELYGRLAASRKGQP
jgi:starch synthase